MKTLLLVCAYAAGVVVAAGCGAQPEEEKIESPLMATYQTVPGHNVAVASMVYSCGGWSYRILYSLEQHQDPASPT